MPFGVKRTGELVFIHFVNDMSKSIVNRSESPLFERFALRGNGASNGVAAFAHLFLVNIVRLRWFIRRRIGGKSPARNRSKETRRWWPAIQRLSELAVSEPLKCSASRIFVGILTAPTEDEPNLGEFHVCSLQSQLPG